MFYNSAVQDSQAEGESPAHVVPGWRKTSNSDMAVPIEKNVWWNTAAELAVNKSYRKEGSVFLRSFHCVFSVSLSYTIQLEKAEILLTVYMRCSRRLMHAEF